MFRFHRPQIIALFLIFSAWPIFNDAAFGESFTGQLEILRSDNFETGISTTMVFLRHTPVPLDRETSTLVFPADVPTAPWRTGDRVSVTGQRINGIIYVESLSAITASTAANSPMTAAAIEERKAVVIIVDMLDYANSLSVSEVAGFMYSDSKNVDGLFEASSYQQVGFNPDTDGVGGPDVFGPYLINYNAADGCNYNSWATAAKAAATADGVDLSIYQHKVYALPSQANCSWAGLGSVGCSVNYCQVWVRTGGGPIFAHELGHNLGWIHSGTDPENDGTLNSEYGDRSGIMGYAYWSQANAPHRDEFNWFDAYPGTLVTTSTGGSFELYALELDPGVSTVHAQVVKIPKSGTSDHYYLSYRRQVGDYPVRSTYANRINIHRHGGTGTSSAHITNLSQGGSWSTVDNNIELTVNATSTGGATAWVGVSLNRLPTAAFTHSVTDLDVQFTESSSDSDGTIQSWAWDFGDGESSTSANPLHSYAVANNYTVTLTVTDNLGGTATVSNPVNLLPPAASPPAGGGGGSSNFISCFINMLIDKH